MNAIFAVNALGGFGVNGTMPWPKSPNDLKRFKNITTGHTVVMGSGTWTSDMPKPLPNRRNCVISKTLVDDRCEIFKDIHTLLKNLSSEETVFVIGGAKLLWAMQPYIDTVHLTTFTKAFDKADIVFDTKTYLTDFELVSGEIYNDHKFEIYKKSVTI